MQYAIDGSYNKWLCFSYMITRAAIAILALFLTASVLWAAGDRATEEENRILFLVLKRSYPDGGYTVVNPETRLVYLAFDAEGVRKAKKRIAKHLRTNGIVVTKFIDRLFERNKEPVRLALESSPKDGYVMDFEGKYEKSFEKCGGVWENWYQENPKAHGFTTVSLPVYDQKTGLVLVYTGTTSNWLAGSGWVILYRYQKGELQEIKRVMMWFS